MLVLVFLSKGLHYPFGVINEFLYNNFILIKAYRTTFYFSISLVTLIPIVSVISINYMFNNYLLIKRFKNIFYYFIYILILFTIYKTYYDKNFINNFFKVKIPTEFDNTVKEINKYENYRFLSIPYISNIGNLKTIWKLHINGSNIFSHFTNNDIIAAYNPFNINNEIILKFFEKPRTEEEYIKLFKYLGISNILYRKDSAQLIGDYYNLIDEDKSTKEMKKFFNSSYKNKFYEIMEINKNEIITYPTNFKFY